MRKKIVLHGILSGSIFVRRCSYASDTKENGLGVDYRSSLAIAGQQDTGSKRIEDIIARRIPYTCLWRQRISGSSVS